VKPSADLGERATEMDGWSRGVLTVAVWMRLCVRPSVGKNDLELLALLGRQLLAGLSSFLEQQLERKGSLPHDTTFYGL
jgi:hypothetical protein